MKKILQYGKHLLGAKGRHGTHSPFVYAFVEQVLRNKDRFRLQGNTDQQILTGKELKLLASAIRFLQPSYILAEKQLIPLLKDILPAMKYEGILVEELNGHHFNQSVDGKKLIVTFCSDKQSLELVQSCLTQFTVYVLLVKPYANSNSEENWFALSALSQVKMRLDLWYLGLLVNDPVFKASQYFRLR